MQSALKPFSSERKTIGVFASQVGRAWGAEFMAGITHAAEANNVNLVHFIGGKLMSFTAPGESKPSFGLYDLVKPDQFDGLLLTTDVSYGTSAHDLETFTKVYGTLPIVTQSVDIPGASMFVPDNIEGMRAVVRHLIEDHGYKRIAFIRGIEGQIDAEQRFQSYKDELKAHDLRFDENFVVRGDYTPESGRAAIFTLLDERKLRFQAVVAANDRMAFGALDALQERGVRVPDDVAVTGFDDLREAQSTGVPLTTVRQSFYTAGKHALETLLRRINGEAVPAVTITPTQLLVRWSCGCLPENVRQAAVAPRDVAKTARLENKREAALKALLDSAGVTEQDPALLQFRDAFGRAWDGFLLTLNDKSTNDEFLKTINSMIELMQKQGLPPALWHNVISMMRRYALGGITSHTTMLKAENLFQQIRLLAGELSQRAQAYRRLVLEQQENILQGFSTSMAPAISLNDIGAAISEHFPSMGIGRWYVMFYSDVTAPQSISSPPPESYSLLLQYEGARFDIPTRRASIGTGQLVPRGKTPQDYRYTAVIMPLSLAKNRFGFMWVEMGSQDWEIYVRIRNLVSSALLRTMLVQQKEQAQHKIERLLEEARERAAELAVAKEWAEVTAAENAKLYSSEQMRREAAEALAKSSRLLSTLGTVGEVPQQIVTQLSQLIKNERSALFLEDVNGIPRLLAHQGLPKESPAKELSYKINGTNIYHIVAKQSESMVIGDVKNMQGWSQSLWLPEDRSWLGVPLYSKNKVAGMLTLSRKNPAAFNQDDVLLATTFAVQASIALDNARLYDELTRFNQMMERMVEQRVDELNSAYGTLEKLDKNKSDFIQVAAHELRTPLTVIKGYMGMLKSAQAIQGNPTLMQAMDGVLQGTDRLHQIVNSMLDVARLENQVLSPHLEIVTLGPILRMIQKDYADDLTARNLRLEIDPRVNSIPAILADSELLQKAIDNVVVNAIKFTPDGGSINISADTVKMDGRSDICEIRIQDTGIGIDPANHAIVFEKLYQLGKVELHSSGKTKFKGGGPGLGLAIAAGIVKAHKGKIWVESSGYDEEKLPGSTFFIQIPLAK
ncbi:MAG TPA: substrate-binding domain-containing protein [Anaerolineales bacterium]|nr:substrate-binding domain-containing protein [Anaerolineales bacterium]